jgi:hypothetical protein
VAATRDRWQPPQIAERWFKPYTTCSIVSYLVGVIGTTLGEMIIWPDGSPYGDKALKGLVNKAWTAVDPEHDDLGFGLSDFNGLAQAWGSSLRAPDVVFKRPKADIIEALKADSVITMAGNVTGVPDPTPLDDHVGGANHRMAFRGFRLRGGQQQTRFYDPMTLDGHANWGKWVPISDMFAFGKKFKIGENYTAERFRIGSQSREAKARRNAAKTVLQVQQRVTDLQEELQEARVTIANKQQKLDACKAQLEQGVDRQGALVYLNEATADLTQALDNLNDIKGLLSVSPLR